MRVALVHDYLTEYGGAERVLEVLHELWPDAPLYTLSYNPSGVHARRFANWKIHQSGMRFFPFFKECMSAYRILAAPFIEAWNFDGYDLVISSTSSYFTKGILTKPETLHISYIHTPPRFLYGYGTARDWQAHPFSKFFGLITNHFLRLYDFATAQRPDVLVANSKEVASRIKRFYGRDAIVIYPPVDVARFADPLYAVQPDAPYFLVVSRLTRAKHVEIAIAACVHAGVTLKVVGTGRQQSRLASHPNIELLGEVSDDQLVGLYQGCQALLLTSEDEDFGIVSVEAMAAGKPVIAYASGGVLETVVDGKTGMFVTELSAKAFAEAISDFNQSNFNPTVLKRHAQKFSKDRFMRKMKALVAETLSDRSINHPKDAEIIALAEKLLDDACSENRHRDAEIQQGVDGEKEHAQAVLSWVEKLSKRPSTTLRIAALFHDIDRIVNVGVGGGFKGDRRSNEYFEHKKAHAKRSAEYIGARLLQYKTDLKIVGRVQFLIEHHDDRGFEIDQFNDGELKVLVAADSLAFFTTTAPKMYAAEGKDRFNDKLRFMIEKMPSFARDMLASQRLGNEVFEKLKNEILMEFRHDSGGYT